MPSVSFFIEDQFILVVTAVDMIKDTRIDEDAEIFNTVDQYLIISVKADLRLTAIEIVMFMAQFQKFTQIIADLKISVLSCPVQHIYLIGTVVGIVDAFLGP